MKLPPPQRKQVDLLLIDAEWTRVQYEELAFRPRAKRLTKKVWGATSGYVRREWLSLTVVAVIVGGCWLLWNAVKDATPVEATQEKYRVYERGYEPFDTKENAQSQTDTKPSPYPSGQVWIPQAYGQWSPVPVETGEVGAVHGSQDAKSKDQVPSPNVGVARARK